jgi:hypothetical protein
MSVPAKYILTEVDGLVVGWDMCGTCKTHITRCVCPGGPAEPSYVVTWREEELAKKRAAIADRNGRSEIQNAPKSLSPKIESASAGDADSDLDVAVSNALTFATANDPDEIVTCRGIDGRAAHKVLLEDADPNDDASYTCHECQEAA